MSKTFETNRRNVLKAAAPRSLTVNLAILCNESIASAKTPSEEFRFAQVGCGGKGWSDMQSTLNAGGKLVAMCDVDKDRAKKALTDLSNIPMYDDYRVMLDKHHKDLDGVVISTPDHTHAYIALEAIKRGKHVYVQKPLARTYDECKQTS